MYVSVCIFREIDIPRKYKVIFGCLVVKREKIKGGGRGGNQGFRTVCNF